MRKLRVHNFAMSLDRYAAGPDQSLENPIGVNGSGLQEWVLTTRAGRQMLGLQDGEQGVDNEFIARGVAGIGATIIGPRARIRRRQRQ